MSSVSLVRASLPWRRGIGIGTGKAVARSLRSVPLLHRPACSVAVGGVRCNATTPPGFPGPSPDEMPGNARPPEEMPGAARPPEEMPSIDTPPEFEPLPPGIDDVPMPGPGPGPEMPGPSIPSVPPRNPEAPSPPLPPELDPPRAPPEVVPPKPSDVPPPFV
ncbi:hypothetical protein BRADI_1g05530v3 [Brachypodium distachyon]|uniref:Uncharacterized protein n=1 Tax=Brachypodium distachyon TaxID=15368 RepID=A0A0Q3GNU4_BRADI|nr:hypothetical protein BRADI_1g05530v3 [Brachypodium distachyon]